jgi:hypothetical protein
MEHSAYTSISTALIAAESICCEQLRLQHCKINHVFKLFCIEGSSAAELQEHIGTHHGHLPHVLMYAVQHATKAHDSSKVLALI